MKEQFPIFTHHPDLVYLDSAATVQKPQYVLDEVNYFLTHEYANIHRGTYPLALAAEEQRERARSTVATLLGASTKEVVFTQHATHSVNTLAYAMRRSGWIGAEDIIVLSRGEHHANILPWQCIAEYSGAKIVYLDIDTTTRQYDYSLLESIDIQRIKLVSLSLVSNVTGQIMDLDHVKKMLKKCQGLLAVDLSQAIPHLQVDTASFGVDFVYFTGHKVGALTGIGVLRGKEEHMDRLTPAFVGGGAVDTVSDTSHTYQPSPDKFEPGTPNVLAAVSLRAAIERIASLSRHDETDLVQRIRHGYEHVYAHEHVLVEEICARFRDFQDQGVITMLGGLDAHNRIGVFSRTLPEGNIHQLGRALGKQQISIRTGAHCTHPLHAYMGVSASARMSLRCYTTQEDIETFFAALSRELPYGKGL